MEDLKQLWQQYDEKLQRTQSFNEQVLRKIATRSSVDRIDKMRNLEVLGLAVLGLLMLLVFSRIDTLRARWEISLSYSLVALQLLGWTAWTIHKLRFLQGLDMSRLAVTEMLQRLARYRLMIMRERLWGGVLTLVFMLLPFMILMDYWLTGSTAMLHNWRPYVLRLIPALAIGIALGLWLYRKWYMQPIDSISRDLREVEEFSATEA